MLVIKDYKQFRICQDLFTRFALHFADIPSNNLELLATHKKFMEKKPELTDFVYQKALEVAYKKKRFSNTELETLFCDQFKIVDMYANLNQGVSDMSTVNSLFILNQMSKNSSLFINKKVSVISTPLEYQTEKYYAIQKSSYTKPYTNLSKLTPGNTNAEVQINHRLYDIKHTKHTANHIYPWSYDRIQDDLPVHLTSLLQNLKGRPDSAITKKLIFELEKIIKTTSKTSVEKNDAWNSFVMNYFDKLPSTYPLPIIAQMTSTPFNPKLPKGMHEMAQISPTVLENDREAINAITGITVLLGGQYNKNAFIMTEGVIPLINTLPNTNDLD